MDRLRTDVLSSRHGKCLSNSVGGYELGNWFYEGITEAPLDDMAGSVLVNPNSFLS